MSAISKKIEALIAHDSWASARTLIEKELKKDPKNHWLLDRLSVTYYEEKQYETAMEVIEQAYKLAPNCVLVLWDYAGTKYALEDFETAIQFYYKIGALITKDGMPKDECALNEGPLWFSAILLDCCFRLGICYQYLNKKEQAIYCLEKYVEMATRFPKLQAESLYSIDDVLARLDDLDGDMEENMAHTFKELMGRECVLA
jgi:tetratricopeptide (TPR) repeat protein